MSIDLVLVTYNRLEYTRKALASILADPEEQFGLYIWDNASSDGTVDFLKTELRDARIRDVVFSKDNVGQTAAVNAIWGASRADLVGKLDNDCLVTPGWSRILAQAHSDIDRLGVVACWHYFPDDFDYERAKHKIQRFGEHEILRHPWTCGTGLLVKRESFRRNGPFRDGATTAYWMKLASKGYINGFYYPLVFQEHMDDPKSEHSHLKDEASYQAAKEVTYSLKLHGQHTLGDRWRRRSEILGALLDSPWQVEAHLSGAGRLRHWLWKRFGRTGQVAT